MNRMYGYHRGGWGRGWGSPHYHRRVGWGFFPFFPLIFLGFFLFFGLLKLLWPLLLIGGIVALFSIALRGQKRGWHQDWGHQWMEKRRFDWHPGEPFSRPDKRKNDEGEKPKRRDDDRRFTTTPDGDTVEII